MQVLAREPPERNRVERDPQRTPDDDPVEEARPDVMEHHISQSERVGRSEEVVIDKEGELRDEARRLASALRTKNPHRRKDQQRTLYKFVFFMRSARYIVTML